MAPLFKEMMNKVTPLISVVIPVYKAEGCLAELYKCLLPTIEPIATDFEIIL